MGRSLEEQTEDFKREKLRGVLSKCTEKQIAFFNRMYGSVETIPVDKMDWAYQQVIRTLEKSKRG